MYFVLCAGSYQGRSGGEGPQENFSPSRKMCWTYFKTIGYSLKMYVPLRKLFPPLVSQAGYGSGCVCPVVVTGFKKSLKYCLNPARTSPSLLSKISVCFLMDLSQWPPNALDSGPNSRSYHRPRVERGWTVLYIEKKQKKQHSQSCRHGGLLGLSPLNKAPSLPNWNMKHYNQLSVCQFLECQVPPHKPWSPRRSAKPFYWKLSGAGSERNISNVCIFLFIFFARWHVCSVTYETASSVA